MAEIKGQIAVEFIFYVGIILAILMTVVFVFGSKSKAIYTDKVSMDMQKISELLAEEINIAVSVGDGYSHEFFVPQKAYNGEIYSVIIKPEYYRVYAEWKNFTYSSSVVTSNITGNFHAGKNKISNSNGVVYIV